MSQEKLTKKEITDYFRSNIFESIIAYSAWKMILSSRSSGMVSPSLAERYIKVQSYHSSFFVGVERAFLVQFVIQILHSFDRRPDSASLYHVEKDATEKFVSDNIKVIQALRDVRNKIFAHRDINSSQEKLNEYKIPSMNDLDEFFKNLIDFYNSLTLGVDKSATVFDNAYDIKNDIENLFMNIQRGETVRKEEIDIEWMWAKDNKKASDIL